MSKEDKKETQQELQKVELTYALNPFEEIARLFEDSFSRSWMHPFCMDWPSYSRIKAFE